MAALSAKTTVLGRAPARAQPLVVFHLPPTAAAVPQDAAVCSSSGQASGTSHAVVQPAGRRVVSAHAFKGFGAKKAVPKCPCGSGQEYESCCQRYHQSVTIQAPTAEAVLRARFSAYAKREWKYVIRTTHPDNPNTKGSVAPDGKLAKTTFEEDVKVSMYNTDFVKLKVNSVEQGASEDEVVIDFRVDILQKLDGTGKKLPKPIPRTITEKALFVKADGRWEFLRALDSNWSRDKLEYVSGAGSE